MSNDSTELNKSEASAAPSDGEHLREEDLPEWVRAWRGAPTSHDLNLPTAALTPAGSSEYAPSDSEMPAWLRDTPLPTSAPSEPAGAVESNHAEEVPAWLHDSTETEALRADALSPATAEPPLAETLPDWMRAWQTPVRDEPATDEPLTPEPTASAERPQEMAAPADDKPLPGWLKEMREGGALEPTHAKTHEPETELPDWLADLDTEPGEPAHAESESAQTAELETAQAPEWLQAAEPVQPTAPAETATDEEAAAEVPDWLKPPTTEALPGAPAGQPTLKPMREPLQGTPPKEPGDGDELAPADIPPWLKALRPTGLETLSGDLIETTGLLAGIRGALPIEPALTLGHRSEQAQPAPTTVPVGGFAELFAPQPPAPAAVVQRQVRQSRSRFSLLGLFVLVVFALAALPFLPIPILSELRGANVTVHQPASDYYQTIEALRANQLILIAFDYAGGSRAELDPQARATLLHLLENKQRIVTLSLVPEGGTLAQDLLNGLNPANTAFAYPYSYGSTHVNLGYQSSGEAALSNLTQNPMRLAANDFTGKPVSSWSIGKDLKSLRDVALLIVFSDDAGKIKRWVEQVGRPSEKALIAGVSAAARPEVTPYYDSKQLRGLLEGVRGTAEYEVLLARPSTASATQDAISYVAIVLAGVLAVGILVALVRRRRTVR